MLVSLDLDEDLHGSRREQVAVPASSDSGAVDAAVALQGGARDLRPVTASAAAQQQADGGGLVERKLQPGRWVLAALSWHQTIAGPVAEILVMRSRAGAAGGFVGVVGVVVGLFGVVGIVEVVVVGGGAVVMSPVVAVARPIEPPALVAATVTWIVRPTSALVSV
jgi:hypothetical protein